MQVSIDRNEPDRGWGLGCGDKKAKNAADLCPEPPPRLNLVHPGPARPSIPRLPGLPQPSHPGLAGSFQLLAIA